MCGNAKIKVAASVDKQHLLDSLQLTQEKEKSSVAQCSTGSFKHFFLECIPAGAFPNASLADP